MLVLIYLFKTHKEDLSNTQLNDRVPINENIEGDSRINAMQMLDLYILENPLITREITNIAKNYEWILKVASVMATGSISKEGTLELPRFMKILKFWKISISSSSVWEIVELTKTGTEMLDERDVKIKHKGIMYYYFLKMINEVVCGDIFDQDQGEYFERISSSDISESEENEEKREEIKQEEVKLRKQTPHTQREEEHHANSPHDEEQDHHPTIDKDKLLSTGDNLINKNNGDNILSNPEEVANADEHLHKGNHNEEDMLPVLEEGWNLGPFEVNIIRWWNWFHHFEFSRHSEDQYINEFNSIGNEITERFPEAVVIGNYERPSKLEWFDIYLRGVGPTYKRDGQGRLFIFRKSVSGRFPNAREINDYLIILSMLYGSSEKLGKAQTEFKTNYGYLIPRPYEFSHEHPADAPAIIKKQPDMTKNVKLAGDRTMICKNWGWGREYQEDKNDKHSCTHHPGKYQFGSINGYWPESWTWCRAEWESLGCRKGFHRGVPKEEFTRLCINHGEPNPNSIYPDSFCGKPFKEPEKKPEWQITAQDKEDRMQWRIHSGYLSFDRRSGLYAWSWWGEDKDSDPWVKWEHKFADFPEEECKKYFYDRPLLNVGTFPTIRNVANEFEIYGRFWGVFRKTREYIPKTLPQKPYISRDEQKKLDQLEQVCLHWAWGKVFKEANNHKRACLCHTGRWDFGNSVKGWTNTASDNLMWEPHWTCCRQDWSSPGWTRMKHKGVYLETYEEIKREYQWPDVRAQIYFKKNISHLWRQKMMDQCEYDEETLLEKINKKERDNRGRLSISDLEELCDYLRLNLLINSDDMSYHFKFQDVLNKTAHDYLDDGNGYISKEKFIHWWFMTTEELFHKYDPPQNQLQDTSHISK